MDCVIIFPGLFDAQPECPGYLSRWVDFRRQGTDNQPDFELTTSLWNFKWKDSFSRKDIDKFSISYHEGILVGLVASLLLSITHLIILRKKYHRRTSLGIAILNSLLGITLLALTLGLLLPDLNLNNPTLVAAEFGQHLDYTQMGASFYMFCMVLVFNIFSTIFALAVLLKRNPASMFSMTKLSKAFP